MKKVLIAMMVAVMMAMSAAPAAAATNDYQLAKEWQQEHCKGGHVEKVNTVSKGGYKGKAGKWSVKYPKKVKKGKKVTVYMVVKKGDIKAMVCLGKVK